MTNASAEPTLARHRLGSHDEWLVAGKVRLAKEKDLTRLRDQLSAERVALGQGAKAVCLRHAGREKVSRRPRRRKKPVDREAFHVGPEQKSPCVDCSLSDHVDGILVHLEHNDVTYVAVARASRRDRPTRPNGWSFE
jgi:predicted dithiol-disulfide oxidoreductase (DUF899 family)